MAEAVVDELDGVDGAARRRQGVQGKVFCVEYEKELSQGVVLVVLNQIVNLRWSLMLGFNQIQSCRVATLTLLTEALVFS